MNLSFSRRLIFNQLLLLWTFSELIFVDSIDCPNCKVCDHDIVRCSVCEEGYTLIYKDHNDICENIECNSPCQVCSAANVCTICIAGYHIEGTTCAMDCFSPCTDCSSPNSCTSCITGYYLDSSGTCNECPFAWAVCSNSASCSACGGGYHFAKGSCVPDCPPPCKTCNIPNICTSFLN